MNEILLAIKEYIIYLFTPVPKNDYISEELEYLRNLYATERMENKRLTNLIIDMKSSIINTETVDDRIEIGTQVPQPVNRPKFIPWSVKQRMLEREDREKFKSLAKEAAEKVNLDKLNTAKSVSELEEVLGVE